MNQPPPRCITSCFAHLFQVQSRPGVHTYVHVEAQEQEQHVISSISTFPKYLYPAPFPDMITQSKNYDQASSSLSLL
jgi:hypothetical protein